MGIINTLEAEMRPGDILVTVPLANRIFTWYTEGSPLGSIPVEVVQDSSAPQLSGTFDDQRLWVFGTHRIEELREIALLLGQTGAHETTCGFDQNSTVFFLLEPVQTASAGECAGVCLIK